MSTTYPTVGHALRAIGASRTIALAQDGSHVHGVFDPDVALSSAAMPSAASFRARYGLDLAALRGNLVGERYSPDHVFAYLAEMFPGQSFVLDEQAGVDCKHLWNGARDRYGRPVAFFDVMLQAIRPAPAPEEPPPPPPPPPAPEPPPAEPPATVPKADLDAALAEIARLHALLVVPERVASTLDLMQSWGGFEMIGPARQKRIRDLKRWVDTLR